MGRPQGAGRSGGSRNPRPFANPFPVRDRQSPPMNAPVESWPAAKPPARASNRASAPLKAEARGRRGQGAPGRSANEDPGGALVPAPGTEPAASGRGRRQQFEGAAPRAGRRHPSGSLAYQVMRARPNTAATRSWSRRRRGPPGHDALHAGRSGVDHARRLEAAPAEVAVPGDAVPVGRRAERVRVAVPVEVGGVDAERERHGRVEHLALAEGAAAEVLDPPERGVEEEAVSTSGSPSPSRSAVATATAWSVSVVTSR